MSITLAGYDYGSGSNNLQHGDLVAPKFELEEVVQTFWGVVGAAVYFSIPTTRILTLDVVIGGYATEALLRAKVFEIQTHVTDAGTLTVNSVAWPLCGFLGFTPDAPPIRDGSGVNGWCQFGKFSFRQIAF